MDPATLIAPQSADWYYHAIAFDEKQGLSYWWRAVEDPRNYGTAYLGSLFEAAYDVTLNLSPEQAGQREFQLGRFYYYNGQRLQAALESYEQALGLFRQVGSKLGEANVLQAMGDVQQFRDEREAALESYEQALGLFRQVGSKLGEANCYLEQGRIALQQEDHLAALSLHNQAYQLYQQIQDKYSQARLLYYRTFVYEAMKQQHDAIRDAEEGLAIARALDLPFIDLFEERLDYLQSQE